MAFGLFVTEAEQFLSVFMSFHMHFYVVLTTFDTDESVAQTNFDSYSFFSIYNPFLGKIREIHLQELNSAVKKLFLSRFFSKATQEIIF